MTLLQAIVLAIVQGLTEFLPISSSGHLILVPHLVGWRDQGLSFDVATHVGTLVAVIAYFRTELTAMTREWVHSVAGGPRTANSRLGWAVLYATIPVGVVGLLFDDFIETHLRSPLNVAASLAVFGILLGLSDRFGTKTRDEYTIGIRDAFLIGMAQALALMPGTSRSGVTISAGLGLGLTRVAAARFAFLMSVPPVFLAGLMEFGKLIKAGEAVNWQAMGVGVVVSAVTGYLCIHYFLRFLKTTGVLPFVIYRLALAAVIVYVFV